MNSFVDITSYGHGAFKVTIVAAVLIVMQILMVGGRFVSRKLRKVPLAADDYVLLTAAILTVGLCALALAFPRIGGIGAPIVTTQMEELSEGKVLGQSFMAWSILYGLSIALSKCAILLLYLRVFTTSNRAFTTCVYLTGSVVVATGIANTFAALFQCSPVAYAWNKSLPGGHCIDEVAFARSMTLPNVVTGAIMLVVPLPLSWRLNLTLSARVALTATFLHGIIGFVASCARLIIFFRTNPSAFSNDTSLVWTIWTINEPANYIIAACLPTLRPLFLRLLPSASPSPSSSSLVILANPAAQKMPPWPRSDALAEGRGPWTKTRWEERWVAGGAGGSDEGVGDGNGRRRAVMRAPGCEEGGLVVEMLVRVSEGEGRAF